MAYSPGTHLPTTPLPNRLISRRHNEFLEASGKRNSNSLTKTGQDRKGHISEDKCTSKHVLNTSKVCLSHCCYQRQCYQVLLRGHKGSLGPLPERTQSGVAATEHSMELYGNQNSRGRGRKFELKAILGFLKKLYNIWAFI